MKTFKRFLQQLNELETTRDRPLPDSITGILKKAGGGGGNKPPKKPREGGGGGGGRGNEPENFAAVLHHAKQALHRLSGAHPDEHEPNISDDGRVTIITNPKNSHEVSINHLGGNVFHLLHTDEDGEHHDLMWNGKGYV